MVANARSTTTECHRGQLSCSLQSHIIHGVVAERVGFEPTIRGKPYDDLANRCLQPLGHLSVAQSPIVSTVSRQTFTETAAKKDGGRMHPPLGGAPGRQTFDLGR